MSNHNSCRYETLAGNGVATVQRCTSCNCISLNVGPVTLRLDDGALEALWLVIGEARTATEKRKEAESGYLCVAQGQA